MKEKKTKERACESDREKKTGLQSGQKLSKCPFIALPCLVYQFEHMISRISSTKETESD